LLVLLVDQDKLEWDKAFLVGSFMLTKKGELASASAVRVSR
jgi:hypothetical protein